MLIIARFRPREYDSEDGPLDPISGATSALLGTVGSLMMGVADFPIEIIRAMQRKPSGGGQSGDDGNTPGRPSTPHGMITPVSREYLRMFTCQPQSIILALQHLCNLGLPRRRKLAQTLSIVRPALLHRLSLRYRCPPCNHDLAMIP